MGFKAHGVSINTTQRMVFYRDFVIEEAYDAETKRDVWEWTHQDYSRGTKVTGMCQTLFECIDAVEDWHDNENERAYEEHQARLMESGGPDDSSYRADMIAAGRGHLLKG